MTTTTKVILPSGTEFRLQPWKNFLEILTEAANILWDFRKRDKKPDDAKLAEVQSKLHQSLREIQEDLPLPKSFHPLKEDKSILVNAYAIGQVTKCYLDLLEEEGWPQDEHRKECALQINQSVYNYALPGVRKLLPE